MRQVDWRTGALPGRAGNRRFVDRISLQTRLRHAGEVFRAGRYIEASRLFKEGHDSARLIYQFDLAARFLGNFGACRFALHDYRAALEAFSSARKLAETAGDSSTAGAMDANISSIYEQMGELDSAVTYARRGAARLSGRDRALHLPKVDIHLASLYARQGRMKEAAGLFARGIQDADRAGDLNTCALGWDRLGEEYLKRGDLAAAEGPLLEAWRVRKLQRLPALETSYRNLGRLKLAQGDLRSAGRLLDEAVERSRHPRALMPAWDVYHARGLVRMAEKRYAAALDDFRVAVRLARAWRVGVSPADATLLSSEQMLDSAYTAAARAAAALYFETGDARLIREAFDAVEENRGLSLRALREGASRRRDSIPPEYWETLARLQAAEVAVLRGSGNPAAGELERLRAALVEMENRGAPGLSPAGTGLLERLRRVLPAGAAYFSFLLGSTRSYLWAVDRWGAAVYALPPRQEIAGAVREFGSALAGGSDATGGAAERLYAMLFGSAAPRFTRQPRWFLSLDDELFGVPVACLREGGRYVAERHAAQVVSGAGLVAAGGQSAWERRLAGTFVGVGDAVYNTADARYRRGARRAGFPFGLLQASAGEGIQLPRLVGSGREIELCAAEWNRGPAILLAGPGARSRELKTALEGRPAVAHLATHVLESSQRSRHGLIALGIGDAGGVELLDPFEIAGWDAAAGLVTLSGCSSGAGQALPGSGLLGLTRAWLASGAAAVAATRWPAADGDGELPRAMYRRLRQDPGEGPAAALARAQADMLAAGGWRAHPRYWGAYFVVANQ